MITHLTSTRHHAAARLSRPDPYPCSSRGELRKTPANKSGTDRPTYVYCGTVQKWRETCDVIASLVDVVLLDIGGTLVAEHPPLTPTDALDVKLLNNVARDLPLLSSIVRLGAATNTAVMREAEVRALLAKVAIDQYMEVVVTSSDVGAAKPNPAVLLEATRRMGDVDPHRTLYIGDRQSDADAAQRAGMNYTMVGANGILAALIDWVKRSEGARIT